MLGLGGLLGSLLAWRLGIWLGPESDVIAHAKAVGKGVTFPAPLKLGAKGVEQIIQLELSAEEKAALNRSADAVREILTVMGV